MFKILASTLCALCLFSHLPLTAQVTSRPSEPLLAPVGGGPGFVDFRVQFDRRGLEFTNFPDSFPANAQYGADDLLALSGRAPEVDMNQFIARIGFRAMDMLTVYAEGGYNLMELNGEKGDGAAIWGIGAHLNLLERILKGTPVHEKKEMLRFSIEANLRQSESDFSPADFVSGAGVPSNAVRDFGEVTLDWQEIEIIPLLTYEVNRDIELTQGLTKAPGVAGHVGVVYTSVEGSFADADFESKDEVGLLLQGDWRFDSGWASFIRAIISGDSDRRIGIGAGTNF